MSRRPLILAALLLAACPAVFAGPATLAAEKAPAVVGQYIDLQPVALPIVVSGQLVNYVFAYVRINLSSGSDVSKLRDKEPYFRDALVREGHRTPFVVAGNWQKIDEVRLAAAIMRDAPAIVGAGVVSSVVVTSQAPQRQVMPPKSVQVGPS
jgi:hypothetical protein